MSLTILSDSILTTIQDLGRLGNRAFGVNPNGAMDRSALRFINILLGNNENEAALEIHFPAPHILFEKDAVIALGGANFSAQIDGKSIENWQTLLVKKGQILSFPQKINGNRIYLSIRGGFAVKEWLNSKSTNLKAKQGGLQGRKLGKDNRIEFNLTSPVFKKSVKLSPYIVSTYLYSNRVRFLIGNEHHLLTPFSSENLLNEKFVITSNSDRMGYRLIGKTLYLLAEKELVSSAVSFGTMQLLPDGQIIILMADHQTTGGYPRIGNVISVDLPILAQLGTNDKISFQEVSIETAEALALQFERDLRILKAGISLNANN